MEFRFCSDLAYNGVCVYAPPNDPMVTALSLDHTFWPYNSIILQPLLFIKTYTSTVSKEKKSLSYMANNTIRDSGILLVVCGQIAVTGKHAS